MFALAAVVTFAVALVLGLTGTDTGDLDLLILGLLFVSLVGTWLPFGPKR